MFVPEHSKRPSRARPAAKRALHPRAPMPGAAGRAQHKSSCACGGGCPRCQSKLSLPAGAPGDAFEREADAVARRVMSGAPAPLGAASPRLQAKSEPASASAPGRAAAAPAGVQQALASPGQAMGDGTRAFFEPRFGHDFSGVRVHVGAAAQRSAHELGARAYTLGPHIVFAAGQFAPDTQRGRWLLAHELAHVVQQRGGAPARPMRQGVDVDEDSDEMDAPVYLCSKSLDTSPLGSHAFFRIGGPGTGNPTLSLQPVDASLGADCWQGMPGRDYPSDRDADASCERTAISRACLERQFDSYPIGHYCTYGPNSNTFVGVLARACGLEDPDPAGWTPGIYDDAPPAGTYAPDKWTTLAGCQTKICIIGPDDQQPVA